MIIMSYPLVDLPVLFYLDLHVFPFDQFYTICFLNKKLVISKTECDAPKKVVKLFV